MRARLSGTAPRGVPVGNAGLRALALLAAVACAACAPTVIWTGHTADRRHAIEIAKQGDLQWVRVDGQRRGAYRAIAAWSIASSGPRFAFAAQRGRRWVVVDGGRPGPDWDGIGELALSGARTAYSAERGGRWHVVVDGQVGPAWDAILAGTLRFAGGRVVYVAQDALGDHVVVDGVVGPDWDGVGQLVVSPDGAHVAYAARQGAEARAVADGVVGPAHRAIAKLALAGATPVYAARDRDGWRVIAGAASPPYEEVRSIVVRDDHVAWLATDFDGDDVVACDGVEVGRAARIADDSLAIVRGCEVAYVALPDGGARVVRGATETFHEAAGAPVVSARGGHVGYVTRRGTAWEVVIDGRAHPGGTWASAPVFSPDGSRAGYLARRDAGMVVVVDGRAHRFDLLMDGTLAFSRDGRHWAVIAGDLKRERLFFAIDGVRRVPLALRELYSIAAQLSAGPLLVDRGDILQAWSAAEAEKASTAATDAADATTTPRSAGSRAPPPR